VEEKEYETRKCGGNKKGKGGLKYGRDKLTTAVDGRITPARTVQAGLVTSVGAAATSALGLTDRATAGSIKSTALVL
jgi:hypothetical protein